MDFFEIDRLKVERAKLLTESRDLEAKIGLEGKMMKAGKVPAALSQSASWQTRRDELQARIREIDTALTQ